MKTPKREQRLDFRSGGINYIIDGNNNKGDKFGF
jgi:hypothetical protein